MIYHGHLVAEMHLTEPEKYAWITDDPDMACKHGGARPGRERRRLRSPRHTARRRIPTAIAVTAQPAGNRGINAYCRDDHPRSALTRRRPRHRPNWGGMRIMAGLRRGDHQCPVTIPAPPLRCPARINAMPHQHCPYQRRHKARHQPDHSTHHHAPFIKTCGARPPPSPTHYHRGSLTMRVITATTRDQRQHATRERHQHHTTGNPAPDRTTRHITGMDTATRRIPTIRRIPTSRRRSRSRLGHRHRLTVSVGVLTGTNTI